MTPINHRIVLTVLAVTLVMATAAVTVGGPLLSQLIWDDFHLAMVWAARS